MEKICAILNYHIFRKKTMVCLEGGSYAAGEDGGAGGERWDCRL
jgi:hypothetical protein